MTAGSSYIPGTRGGPGLSPGWGVGVPGCVCGLSVAPMSMCLGVGVWVLGHTHTGHPGQHSGRGNTALSAQATAPSCDTALATTTHTPRPQQRAHTLTRAAQHSPQQGSHGATTHNTQHNTQRPKPASRPAASTWALLTYLLLFYYSLLEPTLHSYYKR